MTNSTSNLPPYVAFYGMTRDPFSPEAEDDLYYAEPTRKQRLDVLLHLTEYGNEVMVVIGPKGSGKTALLKQFQKNRQEDWKVAAIEVLEGFDERKFLQQLYRQMDLAFRGATFNELLDYIEKHFRQLQENSLVPVILIDNAEQLPVTAIKKILELASLTTNDKKPLIRVIMFGTENVKEKLKLPQLGHLVNLPMRSMDLPPLSEEQTVHYILHRTLAAKFNGKDIFNEPTILKVYRESFGWPARINEVCQDVLIKSVPGKNREAMPDTETKSRNPKQLLAAIIALIVLAVVLAFQNNINELVSSSRDIFANLTTGAQHTEPEVTPNQTITNNESVEPPEPTTLVEKLKNRDPAYQGGTQDKEQEALQSEKPESEQTPTLGVTKQQINNKLDISRGNDWILLQNPAHYTLQVVAGENLETIDDFKKKNQLKDNIALYESLRKGKPWYGLIYDVYENKQMAAAAVDQLPPSLKRVKPWIRSLDGIQKDIRKLPVEQPKKQETLVEKLSKPQPRQQAATTPVKLAPEVPVVEITRQEGWILRQRYNHYTLQLVADDNIETIHSFINRHKLKDSIALYQTTRQNKPWYVLIYGIYSNKSLAESGINRLPANLQLVKPSIRQFNDIHQDIRKISS